MRKEDAETRKRAPYGEPDFVCSLEAEKENGIFDTTQPSNMARYLTVREGWFLGYPVIGEAPLQLIAATPGKRGSPWVFTDTDTLTAEEWRRISQADYHHFYVLACGRAINTKLRSEWMLLVGRPANHSSSTMRHFKASGEGGSGIGV